MTELERVRASCAAAAEQAEAELGGYPEPLGLLQEEHEHEQEEQADAGKRKRTAEVEPPSVAAESSAARGAVVAKQGTPSARNQSTSGGRWVVRCWSTARVSTSSSAKAASHRHCQTLTCPNRRLNETSYDGLPAESEVH